MLDALRDLSDEVVVASVKECVAGERRTTARLLVFLGELDTRRLYLPEGYRSLFSYCVHCLHLSERAAYSRIEASRLARRFPIILRLIADSSVSLTAVAILARHLTEANHRSLLQEATYKTVSEVEEIVARIGPRPDVASSVRKVNDAKTPAHAHGVTPIDAAGPANASEPPPQLPTDSPDLWSAPVENHAVGPVGIAVSAPAVIKPLAPERYKVQFTVSGETRAKLRVVQDLLRHSIPTGDIGLVFDRALSALLADLEKKKLALVARPRAREASARKGSRLIPAAVRRAVWARDKGRCAFIGNDGRCRERGALELHHVTPFAAGGEATVENIELRCRAHNAHEADLYFGQQRGP